MQSMQPITLGNHTMSKNHICLVFILFARVGNFIYFGRRQAITFITEQFYEFLFCSFRKIIPEKSPDIKWLSEAVRILTSREADSWKK